MEMFYAIIFGLIFGFVLNRIGATNPNYIVNMLRLSDTHLIKTILLAIGSASLFMFLAILVGLIDAGNLSVKASYLGVLIGGGIFGLGFALSGYCPGTGLAAAATGRKDGWIFVLGGFLGALVYTIVYSGVKASGLLDDILGGKSTLAQTGNESYTALLSDVPALAVAGIISLAFILIAVFLPRYLRK